MKRGYWRRRVVSPARAKMSERKLLRLNGSAVAARREPEAAPAAHAGHLSSAYPVIDLFAGPGGLGEGFSSFVDDQERNRFRSAVAIERDEFSHKTLLMRHFLRSFTSGEVPDDYYDFLAGNLTAVELASRHPKEWTEAEHSALRISLGSESHDQVRGIIQKRLGRARKWALVGGPPCQAYSLVGRARMMGRPDFESDERHTLYLEYLRIIADHEPPIFVMENVKGLLSATIEGKSAITRIVRDLSRPANARSGAKKDLTYRLFSLSEEEMAEGDVDPRLFIVRAEEHGIPQARHRMFIVGIRSDLNVKPGTLRRMRAPSVRETIGGLPAVRSTLSRGQDSFANWLSEIRKVAGMGLRQQMNGAAYAGAVAKGIELDSLIALQAPRVSSSTRYTVRTPRHEVLRSLYDSRLSTLTGHEARAHMASDLRRYVFAAVFAENTGRSPKLYDFPVSLLPEHQNVASGKNRTMFADRFRVQVADRFATTVTSHISKDGHYFIHYDSAQCRSLTVREAARLQTFPDNYFFAGPRTAQYHQVGNAVPPQLARQIAEIVSEVLDAIPGEA